jgi:hypothetical protein
MERRKKAEAELLDATARRSAAPAIEPVPAESDIISGSLPPARRWKQLGTTTPAELLVLHASQRRTGRLVLASGGREKELFLEQGSILSCASNDPSRFLAQRLVSDRLITEEQRQKALEIQRETHLALGRILIILGALSENLLHDAMRRKAEEEILELFTWSDATFAFVEEAIPTLQLVPLHIDVAELVVRQLGAADAEARLPADLEALDVAGIVDAAVTDLVMDDIAAAADEIAAQLETIASHAEIVVASAMGKTRKFHRASCSTARRFADETRVVFTSPDDALAAGYEACRLCFR